MCVHVPVHMHMAVEQEMNIRSPGVEATGSCKPHSVECLNPHSGPLEEQQVFFTIECYLQQESCQILIFCIGILTKSNDHHHYVKREF